MFRKLLTLAVRGTVKGPAKSWVFTSAAAMLWGFVTKKASKKELIDLSKTRPGDKIIIEHLDITHKQQMKQLKRSKKDDKLLAEEAKRDRRAAKKLARQG
ncbi:MAG: hypothetical protein ACI8TP_001127 [Acidimicrobiales bacterium]|jgi:hypothetical protein